MPQPGPDEQEPDTSGDMRGNAATRAAMHGPTRDRPLAFDCRPLAAIHGTVGSAAASRARFSAALHFDSTVSVSTLSAPRLAA